jgi:endonuclease-8
MQMTGSWHVYRAGERWRKPAWKAAAVLEAGDRVAVCFDAPVVELLAEREVAAHPALNGLGPDVLRPPIDTAEVRRRTGGRPADLPVGELLLDQQVVSGIGNIWRCEVLFVRKVHPWTPQAALAPVELDALVLEAGRLMAAGRRERWVYGRAGRPCRRCGTPIAVRRSGEGDRNLFWCPTCQGAV